MQPRCAERARPCLGGLQHRRRDVDRVHAAALQRGLAGQHAGAAAEVGQGLPGLHTQFFQQRGGRGIGGALAGVVGGHLGRVGKVQPDLTAVVQVPVGVFVGLEGGVHQVCSA